MKLNLEMACSDEIVAIACRIKPDQATLVPERREEVTTEGGLDVAGQRAGWKGPSNECATRESIVSLFLDPDPRQLDLAKALGAEAVELHTGKYALANWKNRDAELKVLADASKHIRDAGMALHAGHGLNYHNVCPVAAIRRDARIEHRPRIVARAVFIGLREAVREMKSLIE